VCVSHFVAVTKPEELIKGLFRLTVLELSVHDCLASWWYIMAGVSGREKLFTS
jgi:hypothetical protein